jgi:hypothetical protein
MSDCPFCLFRVDREKSPCVKISVEKKSALPCAVGPRDICCRLKPDLALDFRQLFKSLVVPFARRS